VKNVTSCGSTKEITVGSNTVTRNPPEIEVKFPIRVQ